MKQKVQPPPRPPAPTRAQLLAQAAQLSSRKAGLQSKIAELVRDGDPTDPEDFHDHLSLTRDLAVLDAEVSKLVAAADQDPEWRRQQTESACAAAARRNVPVVLARAQAAVRAAAEQVQQVRDAVREAEQAELRLVNASTASVTAATEQQLRDYLSDPFVAALDAVVNAPAGAR